VKCYSFAHTEVWRKTNFIFSEGRFQSLLLKMPAFAWLLDKDEDGFSVLRITYVVFV